MLFVWATVQLLTIARTLHKTTAYLPTDPLFACTAPSTLLFVPLINNPSPGGAFVFPLDFRSGACNDGAVAIERVSGTPSCALFQSITPACDSRSALAEAKKARPITRDEVVQRIFVALCRTVGRVLSVDGRLCAEGSGTII